MTNLPPINLSEDVEKYEAYEETTEVSLHKCNHKGKVKFVGNDLRCTCGVSWSGARLNELYKLLNSK